MSDVEAESMAGGSKYSYPAGASSIENIEAVEKAKQLLKRCRYDEAAKVFKGIVQALQLQRTTTLNCSSDATLMEEIGALEGLAICLSRQLNDAEAEKTQRKALSLRCRQWEDVSSTCVLTMRNASAAHQFGWERRRVLELKMAAIPCLRTLATFVSNQGRYVDSETVLRAVLTILEQNQAFSRRAATSGGPTSPPSLAASSTRGNLTPCAAAADDDDGSSGTISDDSIGQFPSAHGHKDRPLGPDCAERGSTGAAKKGGIREGEKAGERSTVASPAPLAPRSGAELAMATGTELSDSSTNRRGQDESCRVERNSLQMAPIRVGDGALCVLNSSAGDLEGHGAGVETEDPEDMLAITRHHLAVVIHAQGRVKEAEGLFIKSVATLKRGRSPQAVPIAQVLHDLAGLVRPTDPGRACCLYLEALQLFEDARGVNHFLAAPTLAKLGFLLGDSILVAAAILPTPAAPAGPGAAGIARSAGLAEAVCAPGYSGRKALVSIPTVESAAGVRLWDADEAKGMIKRAIGIQERHLGLRHPAVALSLGSMAELHRKEGKLSEAEPLFRKAIGIWEASPGPMGADAVAALHGMAHCVLAWSGADWLGRFEEAFSLVDQAYRIASTQPGSDVDGSYSSSRLLLEALRMIRSRQRQGRGDPQTASAAIMEGVWDGRWNPPKNDAFVPEGCIPGPNVEVRIRRSSIRGDDPRCAVCLEEVGVVGTPIRRMPGYSFEALTCFDSEENWVQGMRWGERDVAPDVGTDEVVWAETEDARARGQFAYLPCGHRFHAHCIGRWLVHSSSCPSCRCIVQDDATSSATSSPSEDSSSGASPGGGSGSVGDGDGDGDGDSDRDDRVEGGQGGGAFPRGNAPDAGEDGVDGIVRPPIHERRREDNMAPFC